MRLAPGKLGCALSHLRLLQRVVWEVRATTYAVATMPIFNGLYRALTNASIDGLLTGPLRGFCCAFCVKRRPSVPRHELKTRPTGTENHRRTQALPYAVILEDDVVAVAGDWLQRAQHLLRALPAGWHVLYLNTAEQAYSGYGIIPGLPTTRHVRMAALFGLPVRYSLGLRLPVPQAPSPLAASGSAGPPSPPPPPPPVGEAGGEDNAVAAEARRFRASLKALEFEAGISGRDLFHARIASSASAYVVSAQGAAAALEALTGQLRAPIDLEYERLLKTGRWRGFVANPPLFHWMPEHMRGPSTVDSKLSEAAAAYDKLRTNLDPI